MADFLKKNPAVVVGEFKNFYRPEKAYYLLLNKKWWTMLKKKWWTSSLHRI